ncbi:MAG: hypothetical protein IKV82_04350 [Akkermansia sp.]|nr:hypothetical protein [Akkermansia sp.]
MKLHTLATLGALCAATVATAADAPAKAPKTDWTDAVKKALVIYENPDTFVKKVNLSWREQFQIASVQPNGSNGLHLKKGASPFNQEFRRSWLGIDVHTRSNTQLHFIGRIGGLPTRSTYSNGRTKRNFTYAGIYDAWVKQKFTSIDGLAVRVGKFSPKFTYDYNMSNAAIYTIERSALSNQYGLDTNWGVELTYDTPDKLNSFYWQLMANDRACNSKSLSHRDVYRDGRGLKGEFGWEDKCFTTLGAKHKFAVTEDGYQTLGAEYIHDFNNAYNDQHKKGANYYGFGFRDAVSISHEYKRGKLLFITNLVASFEQIDGNGSNNIGLQLQPVYSINPHVDLVFRYTGMTGDKACKLGSDRYIGVQTNAPTWADSLHTFYFGVDLYASAINKNAAKIMFGAEYTTARSGGVDCYNGWEYTTAVRWNF